ncbi:hypothetical protein KAX17_11865, partial [Candidatus Bipolaricaulota bacterium]|nr:hypothetical protein [Candidatus Bipolaricaulota bacterium]
CCPGLWEGGPSDPRTGTSAVLAFIDLPAQQQSPSFIQSRDRWKERELTYWLRYETFIFGILWRLRRAVVLQYQHDREALARDDEILTMKV